MIICNQFYDKEYITLGDLPAVVDDMKNARHKVKMMGILSENTYELVDATYQQIEELTELMAQRIEVLSSPLKSFTGILGVGVMMQGIPWELLRPNAMKLKAPFNSVTIDLDILEQKKLKELIQQQEEVGDLDKSIGRADSQKLCKIAWRKLKYFVMADDTRNYTQL